MLVVHILNVGKGNSAILDFQDSRRLSMIDIDNSRAGAALTDPVAYFKSVFPGRPLFRFILTHPDMDHMSGLNEFSNTVAIANFWDTNNNKKMVDWEGSPYDKDDWERYQQFRKSEKDPKCLRLHQSATSDCCWTQDEITILAPTKRLDQLANEAEEYNHQSYVLLVEHRGVRILFGGDASEEAWDEILTTRKDGLKADIFVAPHHGSENNIHGEAFKHIQPDWVLVSVAEGTDYAYEYYKQLARDGVASTKQYGNIWVTIPGNGMPYRITAERA